MADALSVPVNSGMMSPATPMPQDRQRAEHDQDQPEQLGGELERLAAGGPACSSSVNTGTNAADSAACENRLLNRFGICEATVNAEAAAVVPKKLACTTSRPRPAIRDRAVARAKIAVLRASRRRGGEGGGGGDDSPGRVLGADTSAL